MGLMTKIMAGVIAALFAACSWMAIDLYLTKDALEEARATTKNYEQIVESQDRIVVRERELDNIVEEETEATKDAPNANVPVPADIAIPWGNAIDRLRDRGSSADQPAKQLSRPDAIKTGVGNIDTRDA